MKKSMTAMLLSACMAVPCVGMAQGYTAGAYTAEAQGFSSAVKATVTVDDSAITNVKLDVSGETPTIGGAAGEALSLIHI